MECEKVGVSRKLENLCRSSRDEVPKVYTILETKDVWGPIRVELTSTESFRKR